MRGFHDLLREKPSFLSMLLGWSSISITSLMMTQKTTTRTSKHRIQAVLILKVLKIALVVSVHKIFLALKVLKSLLT
jgi:hypothetical protein